MEMWVANFINKQSSPTESALDPPYGEIQESYLIYDVNAMQVLSDSKCSWLVLWQVQKSYLIYDVNAMQVVSDRECSWLVLWHVQESLGSF